MQAIVAGFQRGTRRKSTPRLRLQHGATLAGNAQSSAFSTGPHGVIVFRLRRVWQRSSDRLDRIFVKPNSRPTGLGPGQRSNWRRNGGGGEERRSIRPSASSCAGAEAADYRRVWRKLPAKPRLTKVATRSLPPFCKHLSELVRASVGSDGGAPASRETPHGSGRGDGRVVVEKRPSMSPEAKRRGIGWSEYGQAPGRQCIHANRRR